MRSGALFEDREEYWQLPLQEASVGDWQKAAIDVEEKAVDSMGFVFGDVGFKLQSQTSWNILPGMRGDIWRSMIFSLIVTSKGA